MNDNNDYKKYESFKIPDRKQNQGIGGLKSSPKMNTKPSPYLSDGMFYEIEYNSSPVPNVGKFVTKSNPQKIREPEKDEIRELFGQMRDIARAHRSTYDFSRFYDKRVQNINSVIFYQQGLFMQDFTDDFAKNTPFTQYFPCYQMMGYEQLRTYFTWRTQIRSGNVADISLSYAFLYVYELLSNIGVTDPQDGLDKLIFFWKAFRKNNKSIDKYVLRWLKDYHIYYKLPHSFKKFVEKNDLAKHYPKFEQTEDSFNLYCKISKYNIKKSTFYTDETSKMISDCFSFVINRIKQDFETAGMNFDNAFFRPARKIVAWKPFKDALFYHWLKQPDKQIVLSEDEIYMCKKNEWTFSTIITTEKGRQFIGYVMKQMESVLRKVTKFKFKLTANTSMINEDTIRILTKAGLFIERIVPAAVIEYHRETTKTVVTVDHTSLARIREEALVTQESLIVEEQAQPIDITPAPAIFSMQDQNVFAGIPGEKPGSPSNIWDNLKDALNEHETKALMVILRDDDIKAFADECGIMVEVLVDGINEKAMDYIGDNLMDDDFVLYDDYIEKVKEMVR